MLHILRMQELSSVVLESVCGGRRTQSPDAFAQGLDERLSKWNACVAKQVADKGLTDPVQIQAAADQHCMRELIGPMRR